MEVEPGILHNAGRWSSQIQNHPSVVEISRRGLIQAACNFLHLKHCNRVSGINSPPSKAAATEGDPGGPLSQTQSPSGSPVTITTTIAPPPSGSLPQPGPSIAPPPSTSQNVQNPAPNSTQPIITEASGNEPSATSSNKSPNGANTTTSKSSPSNDLSLSTVVSISTVVHSDPPYASQTLPPPTVRPPSPTPSTLSTGVIVSIALGALATIFCVTLALFLLLRRRRARSTTKRTSVESARRRLKPYSYDSAGRGSFATSPLDGPSRPISSVWTWFGSVAVDPDFKLDRGSTPHSLNIKSAEKDAGFRLSEAYSPEPLPCSSPALAETRPLARDVPVSSVPRSLLLGEYVPHLNVPNPDVRGVDGL